jgi:membrane protease YdiL (CAAX protease family)
VFQRLASYVVLTLVLTMFLGGLQQETNLLVGQVILPQLAPGLAALLTLAIFRKDRLALNLSVRQALDRRSVLALLLPVGAALIIGVSLAAARILDLSQPIGGSESLSLIGMSIGAVGEELGWRGYAQKLVDQRLVGWLSCLVIGIPWALWHLGLYANGPLYVLLLIVVITSYTFVLYTLVKPLDFNVWTAALFHLMVNVTNVAFLGVIDRVDFMLVNALVWAAIAGVIVALNRARYSEHASQAPDAAVLSAPT